MYSLKASSDLVPFSLKIVNSLKKKKRIKNNKGKQNTDKCDPFGDVCTDKILILKVDSYSELCFSLSAMFTNTISGIES